MLQVKGAEIGLWALLRCFLLAFLAMICRFVKKYLIGALQ